MDLQLPPAKVKGTLTPPCSKSYAQRALAASLLSEGRSTLRGLEFCSDTRSALRCIEALGAQITPEGFSTLHIQGGLSPCTDRLYVGEAGLSARLFTPIAALCATPIRVEGEGSLLSRPMQMMIEPLQRLGVALRHNGGYLPFEVCGPMQGGDVEVDGSLSSQFITGLLLALPLAGQDSTLHIHHAQSLPYIEMTLACAARFGVEISHRDFEEFYIPGGQRYEPADYTIEGDWSAAAMLLVAGATAGEVTLKNLSPLSKQADTLICRALERAGASLIHEEERLTVAHRPLHAFSFDATHAPDLFPALVALAAAAEGVSVIRGTSRLAWKESNRAETLRSEYGKLGIEIDLSEADTMKIRGGEIHAARVSSCNDHRIAMSLAVAGLRADAPLTLEGAECVGKSYPDFFEQLNKLR